MRGRSWAAVGGIFLSLALSATAEAQTYTPGGRTLGDRLPSRDIGNTGYDAQHYDLTLKYDPATNTMLAGTKADITMRATQNLSEFALDFRGLNVTGITIDGVAATFTRENDDAALQEQADRHAGRGHRLGPRVPHGRLLRGRARSSCSTRTTRSRAG